MVFLIVIKYQPLIRTRNDQETLIIVRFLLPNQEGRGHRIGLFFKPLSNVCATFYDLVFRPGYAKLEDVNEIRLKRPR